MLLCACPLPVALIVMLCVCEPDPFVIGTVSIDIAGIYVSYVMAGLLPLLPVVARLTGCVCSPAQLVLPL